MQAEIGFGAVIHKLFIIGDMIGRGRMKTCYVFGALDGGDIYIGNGDRFIVAADGGYEYLRRSGIIPDMAAGDFDSLGYIPADVPCMVRPAEKDQTDTLLAVMAGFERSCDVFVIYGGIGGRIDHTLANIQTLTYIARRGARGYLAGQDQVVSVFSGRMSFPGCMKGYVSVFAVDGRPLVTISGLKYPLDRYEMDTAYPIGVSNEFTGTDAYIEAEGGFIAVVWEQSVRDFSEFIGL